MATTRDEKRAATRARVLAAAQAEFGERGMEAATVRGIARRAGVDPSLVLQHYGSKQELFALSVAPVAELGEDDEGVADHLSQVLGTRLRELPPATAALLRSMLTSPQAATAVRDHLQGRLEVLAASSDREDAELRAALLVSSVLGLTVARHFLQLDALGPAHHDRLAELFESWSSDLL